LSSVIVNSALAVHEKEAMTSGPKGSAGRRDLSVHILSASVVMIGVSTTLIGLVKVAKAHISPSRVDQYAGLVGLLLLLSAVVSYVSIRVIDRPDLSQRCERIADQLFICGLVGITAIALLFAFGVI
jgi:hypothetical protein